MPTKDFLGKLWAYKCMGCAIANQTMQPPGGMIQRTTHFCVHQDPLIPLPGFLVIASTRHIRDMSEMGEKEYEEYARLIRTTYLAIKQATQIENLTLVQEEWSSHFHFWFFPWTDAIIHQYGNPSLNKIRGIMADYKQKTLRPDEWAELNESIQKIRALLA